MGLGAARWAEIGTYNLETKDYKWQKLDGPLEIISLQGNVAWEGDEPVLHIHGTFSDDKLQTYGGHIKELEISATCEIFMHHWWGEDRLTRLPDDETGLKLLDL
ncbi:MAG: hypothetical protein JWS12_280 [Candidatus Saccharibacteria bacterium]|nr:hypothetical protein [Candidatus Saccharibacteria bacterium]